MNAAQLLRITGLSYLAGLEVKLYSDVPHHESMIESAPATHAALQVGRCKFTRFFELVTPVTVMTSWLALA